MSRKRRRTNSVDYTSTPKKLKWGYVHEEIDLVDDVDSTQPIDSGKSGFQ